MSVIVTILLYVFGLDAATGKLNFKCDKPNEKNKGNLIYSSTAYNKPNKPNIKNMYMDTSYSDAPNEETIMYKYVPLWSSDHEYE
jgi:hypothetical protein